MRYSVSEQVVGSHKNAYMSSSTKFCYGKGTTYGYELVDRDSLQACIPDFLFKSVSPYIYKGGHRHASNLIGVGDVLVFDMDADYDIRAELFGILSKLTFQYALLPTQNHLTPTPNGALYFKYRLLVPVKGIDSIEQYQAMLKYVTEVYKLPKVDSATYTDARFYAPAVAIEGLRFNTHSPEYPQPFVVTDQDFQYHLQRLQLVDETGTLVLDPTIYPYSTSEYILEYTPECEMYINPEPDVETSSRLSGRILTELYEDSSNKIDSHTYKMLTLTEQVALGDVAYGMKANDRVFCQCPTHHNHSDPNDIRYSWLLKTSTGETRLYCSSDHCKAEFGEFRVVSLPDWHDMMQDAHFKLTLARTEPMMEAVTNNLALLMTEAICNVYGIQETAWHKKKEQALIKMFDYIIDKNALYIFILCIVRDGTTPTILDISLAGGVVGQIVAKSAHNLMQGGWYSYLFKAGWSQFRDTWGKQDMTKKTIVTNIVNTVIADINYTTVVKQKTTLKPSQLWSSSVSIGLELGGKLVNIVNNSFDDPIYRNKSRLEKEGILKNSNYRTVVKEFLDHWQLPYGAVEFDGASINDLASLILMFSCFNVYTDGVTNQRHSTFVITAPSGIGKSSLIKNMHAIGLTNDEGFGADVFGVNGLYPKSIESLKNKLFNIGDELSPAMMKGINMSLLLSNLTRRDVNVNVKGKIDNEFSSFAKVLWGARAWEAISIGTQATELRKRLFAITYYEDMFTDDMGNVTPFLRRCEVDFGEVDDIIQHHLASTYIAMKNYVLSMDMPTRVAAFGRLKTAIKAKYAGTLSYEIADVESTPTADIVHNQQVSTQYVVKEVVSDSLRMLGSAIGYLLKHREHVVNPKPGSNIDLAFSPLTPKAASALKNVRREQYAQGAMYYAHQNGIDIVVIPDGVTTIKKYLKEVLVTLGASKTLVSSLTGGGVSGKVLMSAFNKAKINDDWVADMDNLKKSKKPFYEDINTKDMRFIALDVKRLEDLYEEFRS